MKRAKYVTDLQKCFEDLRNSEHEKSEAEKVRILVKGIKASHSAVVAEVAIARDAHRYFTDVAEHISSRISEIFADVQNERNARPGKGARRVSAAGGRGGGRGGRGGNNSPGKKYLAGVDVTNPTNQLSRSDVDRIKDAGKWQEFLNMRKNYIERNRGRSGGSGRSRGGSQGSRGGSSERRNNDGDRQEGGGSRRQAGSASREDGDNERQENADSGSTAGRGFGPGRYGGRGRN
jgi:hypothetical protein